MVAAGATAADVDAELAVNHGAGDLGLVLLGRAGRLDVPPAARGAGAGQLCLVGFVNARRDGPPASLGAIIIAALAAGPLRIGLGRTFGERGRLAFAVAAQLLDRRLQGGDAGFQFRDSAVTLDTPGTSRIGGGIGLHAESFTPQRVAGADKALNNYE
jgi:hypothetical protein